MYALTISKNGIKTDISVTKYACVLAKNNFRKPDKLTETKNAGT